MRSRADAAMPSPIVAVRLRPAHHLLFAMASLALVMGNSCLEAFPSAYARSGESISPEYRVYLAPLFGAASVVEGDRRPAVQVVGANGGSIGIAVEFPRRALPRTRTAVSPVDDRGWLLSDAPCADVSGAWDAHEVGAVTLTLTFMGESDTDTYSLGGYGTIDIAQAGCGFHFTPFPSQGLTPDDLTEEEMEFLKRSGVVTGNDVSIQGAAVIVRSVIDDPGIVITSVPENWIQASGTVSGDTMSLESEGRFVVNGTVSEAGQTAGFTLEGTLNSTATLRRLPQATPAVLTILPPDRDFVWANGREHVNLTVLVEDGEGRGVPGRLVELGSPDPDFDVRLAVTDSNGEASFHVRSTRCGTFKVTATDLDAPSLVASTVLRFVQRRVVVFVQGINTSLDDTNRLGGYFPHIRQRLIGERFVRPIQVGVACGGGVDDDQDGVPDDDCPLILDFSYRGGFVTPDSGNWVPYDYRPSDTANSLRRSVAQLHHLLTAFSAANPNTRFVVIGHSQGGLIALQSLHFLDLVKIDSVITLDGALGGTPRLETWLARLGTDWGNPAAMELIRLYEEAAREDHTLVGSVARLWRGPDNQSLVTSAIERGTKVLTIGNLNDCVFNPRECIDLPGLTYNVSSQYVQAATVFQRALGGDDCSIGDQALTCLVGFLELLPALSPIPTLPVLGACRDAIREVGRCILASHHVVLQHEEALDKVIEYVGSPTVSCDP